VLLSATQRLLLGKDDVSPPPPRGYCNGTSKDTARARTPLRVSKSASEGGPSTTVKSWLEMQTS